MDVATTAKKTLAFKFGVAFGQFSAAQTAENFRAISKVLPSNWRKHLPNHEELKATLWWDFDPSPSFFDGSKELYEYFEIGMLVYLRFVLSLQGHPNPESQEMQIKDTDRRLSEIFFGLGHEEELLKKYALNLNSDQNQALQSFVEEFSVKIGNVNANDTKLGEAGGTVVNFPRKSVHSDSDESQMTDSAEHRLDNILSNGQETETVEFKQTLRCRVSDGSKDKRETFNIMKTISGFCNQQGGTLIVGVNDNAKPTDSVVKADGFNSEDQVLNWLADQLVNWLGGATAAALVQVGFEDIRDNGRRPLVVRCTKGARPTFVRGLQRHQDREFYVRIGTSTRQLTGQDLVNFMRERFNET